MLDPACERVGEDVDLRRADVGREQERQPICGSGSRARKRVDLLALHRRDDRARNSAACARSCASRSDTKRSTASRVGARSRADVAGTTLTAERLEAPVDDDRAERDAGAVLDRERGVDQPR